MRNHGGLLDLDLDHVLNVHREHFEGSRVDLESWGPTFGRKRRRGFSGVDKPRTGASWTVLDLLSYASDVDLSLTGGMWELGWWSG
jgi:hypothetical protein